jgi:hypothetical protein
LLEAPYSSYNYQIDERPFGSLWDITGESSDCNITAGRSTYFTSDYNPWQESNGLSITFNTNCTVTLTVQANYGNGGDYSGGFFGSITINISELFGTHVIPAASQSCTSEGCSDGVWNQTVIIS